MSNNENQNKRPLTPPPRPGGGGPPRLIHGEKAKDFKDSMKKLIGYMGKYSYTILFVTIIAIGSAVFSIIGPKILGNATDEMADGIRAHLAGTGGINFEKIGQIMLTLILLYAFSAVLSYIQGFIMANVTNKVSYNLRTDINNKIHKLPFSYYDKVTHGDVLSRITNDVDSISQSLNQSITQIITSLTTVLGIFIMMLSISWQLSLITFASIPIIMVSMMFIVKKSQKYFKDQQNYLGKANGHIEEMLGSHIVVKAFNGEDDSIKTFSEYNDKLYKSAWKSTFFSGFIMPISKFVGNLSYVGVCIVGGYLATKGTISIGNIQAFIQYVRSFIHPISQIANISGMLQQTAAAAERVFQFLSEDEEIPEKENALTVNRSKEKDTATNVSIKGNVTFKNVAFGYTDKVIINDFTSEIKQGQKIAIVGPTGAGKTTIVKLLMRFYDIKSGAIMVDGYDIREFTRKDLRSLFGMVLQDTWLYNGTIEENIRYGKLDASREDVIEAAKIAQAHHFIKTLPGAYDMALNEEADNISQGQKQLMTIARAILADPEILILDEATSSVDTRTEVLIQKAMDNLMHGRTSFIIAHRLSTIRNADLILCMKDGDIIEQGSHDELITKNGFYANLYNSQFEHAG